MALIPQETQLKEIQEIDDPNKIEVQKSEPTKDAGETQNLQTNLISPDADVTTTTEQANALLNQQREEQRAKEQELFGESFSPATEEEERDLFLEKQEEQKTRLQEQIEMMNKRDEAEVAKAFDQGSAAIQANAAQFAQGREGVMSATKPMIAEEFQRGVVKKLNQVEDNLRSAQQQRQDALMDLEEAQRLGKSDFAEAARERIARAENQIRQEKLALGEQAEKARNDAFKFMEMAPAGSFSGVEPMQLAASLGVDEMTASMLISMDAKKKALEEREFEMDDLDYQLKKSNLEKNMTEARWAGMTTDQKNFEYYQQLAWTDPAGAQKFAQSVGLEEKSFFGDFNKEWTQKTTQMQQHYQSTGGVMPLRSKYKYEVTPDGAVSFAEMAPAGQPLNSTRRQCGAFVNDCINGGPGVFGDTFQQKSTKINSKLPVAGGAFVEDVGDKTGHVGMVEKVYPDGSFDIRESNYRKNEKGEPIVTTANVTPGSPRWKSIVEGGGFHVPEGAPEATRMAPADLAETEQGLAANPMFQNFAQGLSSGQVSISDLKAMGMSGADIGALQAYAFTLPKPKSSVSGADLSTYSAAIRSGDVKISDLKNLGFTDQQAREIHTQALQGGLGFTKGEQASAFDPSGTVDPQIQQAAEAIFTGNSTLTIDKIPQDMRVQVETQLNKMRTQALESGDIAGAMRASAGGKQLSDSSIQRFEKTANVINQTNLLQQALTDRGELKKAGAGPLRGWLRKKNPWDTDAQELNAILQGTVPNLARGVFGEVGVLTDKDIELYKKTLPNLEQTADVQKSVTALTLRTLRNSMENQIKIQAGSGVDVSGLTPFYLGIDAKVKQMERELGIIPPEEQASTQWGLPEDPAQDVSFDF